MSRYARKVDANTTAIVSALRAVGVLVEPRLARVGEGVPDLLCGYRGVTYLLEVKDGRKPPSARRLTSQEEQWHRNWNGAGGPCYEVKSAQEAVLMVTGRRIEVKP